jgi:uroporphyrinogen decarboxylase
MRQAGRSLPEYRGFREKHDFMKVATTPELAAQATIMPVDRLGVDGAVLFADIMLPLACMGVGFRIEPGIGPVIDSPIRSERDILGLERIPASESTPYVFDAIHLLRQQLGDRAAVLGFAGAPFTLACYLIEGRGSRDFPRAKALMYGEPELWHRLLHTITDVTIEYLKGQADAGADAVQLFDSWLGLVGPKTYETHVLPYTTRIFGSLRGLLPAIHFSTGTTTLLRHIGASGCSAVSVDWRLPLDQAWERIGYDLGIQGNMDPTLVLAGWPAVEDGVRDILLRANGRPGHIFNLGHGILPATDPEILRQIVGYVHDSSVTARATTD